MPMPSTRKKLRFSFACHTLLNTRRTVSISERRIHRKEAMLMKPNRPDSAVVIIFSEAARR